MARHEDAYKITVHVGPKVKRRLRRSQEWQINRAQEVNKRRNIGKMSPCREFALELTKAVVTTSRVKRKNTAQENQKHIEHRKRLQKWTEERKIMKRQIALEKAKHKPFSVHVRHHTWQNTIIDNRMEEIQKQKHTGKGPPTANIPTTQKTRATTAASTKPTSIAVDTTTTTRCSTCRSSRLAAAQKQVPTAPAAAPRSTAQATATTTTTAASHKQKAASKKTIVEQTPVVIEVVEVEEQTTEPVGKEDEDPVAVEDSVVESKTVSFAPNNFVFRAPENLQSYTLDFSSLASNFASPNSTRNFYFTPSEIETNVSRR